MVAQSYSIYTSMTTQPQHPGERTAAVIAQWRPRVGARAAGFARETVTAVAPVSPARARSLLWATSRLGEWVLSVGLEPVPDVALHPSVIERYVGVGMTGRSEPARRTARANLRFVARRIGVAQPPPPRSLRRNRAKAPYSQAEVAAYFALARAQPTPARRNQSGAFCAWGWARAWRAPSCEVCAAATCGRSRAGWSSTWAGPGPGWCR